ERPQKTGAPPPPPPGPASPAPRPATHASPSPVRPSTRPESHSPDRRHSPLTPQTVALTSSHPRLTPTACPPTSSVPTPTTAQNNSPRAARGAAGRVWLSLHNTPPATVGAPCWACAPALRLRRDSPPSKHTTGLTPFPHSIRPILPLVVC